MGKIKQLSSVEAQKIAAGEVVERPANVVKELLENALDAGATQIRLEVHDGGKKRIRVVDNGYGMSQEDAHACFLHHATSKITSVDQLDTLTTFGFRGEALSSIAAVSKITLLTKDEQSEAGVLLRLEAAEVVKKTSQPCNTGTDITVEAIFFNVPARFKFLKTRDTEWRQILLLFHSIALSYTHVQFTLLHDDKLIYNCPAVDSLEQRVAQLYEHHVAAHMVPVSSESGVVLRGVISNHQYYKYDRNHIFVFVNNRWIKNYKMVSALIKGYMNVLPEGKYPLAALFINIDQSQVDVNVHPRKEEVQFLHPRIVEQAITALIKQGLETNLAKQLKVSSVALKQTVNEPVWSKPSDVQAYTSVPEVIRYYDSLVEYTASIHTPFQSVEKPFVEVIDAVKMTEQELIQAVHQQSVPASIQHTVTQQEDKGVLIGQYNKTYILIEKEDGLYVIDQHAAHERIMYEQFSNKQTPIESVSLLFPQSITLSADQADTLEKHLELLHACGIAIERFGTDTFLINSLPVYLKSVDCSAIITSLLNDIYEYASLDVQEFTKRVTHALYAQMACKAAVKAGDVLTNEQMHTLIATLVTVENRLTCPHGRPTGWLLPLYDIEKKFKRKL